jgi:hypothetical protein
MKPVPESNPILHARAVLQQVRADLLHPTAEALVACLPLLESASFCIAALHRERFLSATQLQPLLQDIREVNALVRQAADFYLDGLAYLSAGKHDYGRAGEILSADLSDGRLFGEG